MHSEVERYLCIFLADICVEALFFVRGEDVGECGCGGVGCEEGKEGKESERPVQHGESIVIIGEVRKIVATVIVGRTLLWERRSARIVLCRTTINRNMFAVVDP